MFAHLFACFFQYYQKKRNNLFSLVFHVASGIVCKTDPSTVYQFLWHFLLSVMIFQPFLCNWCCSELPGMIWRSLCQVKVSQKNRMGCSRLGEDHMEFILPGFSLSPWSFTLLVLIWTCCPSAVARTFLMNCLNGFIYRYWVFFHTPLVTLLCCFCFPLGVRGEEWLPLPPSIDQLSMTEILDSTGLFWSTEWDWALIPLVLH